VNELNLGNLKFPFRHKENSSRQIRIEGKRERERENVLSTIGKNIVRPQISLPQTLHGEQTSAYICTYIIVLVHIYSEKNASEKELGNSAFYRGEICTYIFQSMLSARYM
jgi:hypothetical protein